MSNIVLSFGIPCVVDCNGSTKLHVLLSDPFLILGQKFEGNTYPNVQLNQKHLYFVECKFVALGKASTQSYNVNLLHLVLSLILCNCGSVYFLGYQMRSFIL